jgi:hypothetical protein
MKAQAWKYYFILVYSIKGVLTQRPTGQLNLQKQNRCTTITDDIRYTNVTVQITDNSYVTVKVKVTLRPTANRPVRLGVRPPSGTRDQFLFLLEILFRQLRVCYFVAPPLTRGRVCNLLLLLVLASTVRLGSALSDEWSVLSSVSINL